jgi:hypothetical protein
VFAGVRARLAVIVLVLTALVGAGLANVRADSANLVREARIPTHESGCRPANRRAIMVQVDATGHVGDVLFTQAGCFTTFAGLGATDASLDAGLVFISIGIFLARCLFSETHVWLS